MNAYTTNKIITLLNFFISFASKSFFQNSKRCNTEHFNFFHLFKFMQNDDILMLEMIDNVEDHQLFAYKYSLLLLRK